MSQFFASGGQRIGVSASASVLLIVTIPVLPIVTITWIKLGQLILNRVNCPSKKVQIRILVKVTRKKKKKTTQ